MAHQWSRSDDDLTYDQAMELYYGEKPDAPRYVVVEREPSELAKSYGLDYPMFDVRDTETGKRVPFGAYRTRERAEARIRRILDREAA